MMKAFAALADKLGDKVLAARQLLDKLNRSASQIEVLPEETAARLLAYLLRAARVDREITSEPLDTAVNRTRRNRDVIESHPDTGRQSHAKPFLLFAFVVTGPLCSRSLYGHAPAVCSVARDQHPEVDWNRDFAVASDSLREEGEQR